MRMKRDRALKKPLAGGAICFGLAAQYVLAQNSIPSALSFRARSLSS